MSERLWGTYLLGVEPILVFEHDGALVLSLAEVPPEFAARAVPAADGFRLEGGDVDGASLVFAEGDPCPGGVLGGVLGFERAPEGYELPGGRGLDAPPLELDPDEEATYERLLAELRESPDGDWLELGDDRPRWRFVDWLTRQEAVIFHGSPKPDIDVFLPVRSSIEVMDHAGKGNLAAVYGTPVGLWALWFAVLDRSAFAARSGTASSAGPTARGVASTSTSSPSTTRTWATTSGAPEPSTCSRATRFGRARSSPAGRTRTSGRARRRSGRSSASPSIRRTSPFASGSAVTTTRR